jgi:hypothetical protein
MKMEMNGLEPQTQQPLPVSYKASLPQLPKSKGTKSVITSKKISNEYLHPPSIPENPIKNDYEAL